MSDTWDEDTDDTGAESPVEPGYPDVEGWVTQWLSPTLRRNTNTKRGGAELAWCPRWWAHAEAIDRLESMWRAWEAARVSQDPSSVAQWWLTIADPMLAVLLDADIGPFSACRRDGHQQLRALPVEAAPPRWWGNATDVGERKEYWQARCRQPALVLACPVALPRSNLAYLVLRARHAAPATPPPGTPVATAGHAACAPSV